MGNPVYRQPKHKSYWWQSQKNQVSYKMAQCNICVETAIYVIYSRKIKSGFNTLNLVLLMSYPHWHINMVLTVFLVRYCIGPLGFLCAFHSCASMNVCSKHILSGLCVCQSCFSLWESKALGGQGPFVFIFYEPSWHKTKIFTERALLKHQCVGATVIISNLKFSISQCL